MRAVAAGCLAIALLTTGCSDSDEPSARSTPDASAVTSPAPSPGDETGDGAGGETGSPTPAPVPEPPRARDNERGRTAFAQYVLQAWIYALNTNDAQPLLEVSGSRPCVGCRDLANELASRAEEGWYVALQDVRVGSTRVRGGDGNHRVLMRVSLPESDTFYDDGRYRSTNPAHTRSTFEVEMTYTRRGFRLDAFSLY